MYVIKLYNNKNFYVNYRWPRRKKFPVQVNCIGNYSICETYGNLAFRPDIMKHCERQYSSLYSVKFTNASKERKMIAMQVNCNNSWKSRNFDADS